MGNNHIAYIPAISSASDKCVLCDNQIQDRDWASDAVCNHCGKLMRGAGMKDEEILRMAQNDAGRTDICE
jgi:ribosomal protein L37AE/L43A